MTALLGTLLERRRLVAALVALLTILGAASWMTMPRQEDPSFVDRFGTIVVPFPGADAERVERLVLRPIEDALAEAGDIRKLEGTARAGVAVLTVQLDDDVYETTEAWDEVRAALDRAAPDLPPEAGPIELDDRVGDPASIVLLVTGTEDRLALRDAARTVEQRLLGVPGVSRVQWLGDPGAQLSVRFDPALLARLGLDPQAVSGQLRARNVTLSGGTLQRDGRQVVLRPEGELADVDELRATPIVLADGSAVPLGELADVRLEPLTPAPDRILANGHPAVGLSVVPELPRDLVTFGEDVAAALDSVGPRIEPLTIEVFAWQPDQVRSRIGELSSSLLLSVLIVAAVLFVAMGPRLGGVVASVVPLVALGTMGLYAMGGGVLHQISIAALVLALGLLVDNAIVMAESVQQHLDAGKPPGDAARAAIAELAVPLGTATGTTLAAFVPMLLSSGGTGDFTRAIPVVLMTALALSYAYALAVTPALAAWALRPSTSTVEGRLERVSARVAQLPAGRVLAGIAVALVVTVGLAGTVPQEFFPLSDRNRFVVSVDLPEGTHLDRTTEVASGLADAVSELDGVTGVTTFAGRGLPRFYYNLNNTPSAPHAASLVVETTDREVLPDVLVATRELAGRWPEAVVVAKRLQQGPPVGAPVEVRVSADTLDDLRTATEAVTRALRDTSNTRDVRHDLGVGVPTVRWTIDDAATTRAGLGRGDVALALLSRTRGISAGQVRGGWEPMDVIVGSPEGEATEPRELWQTAVTAPGRPSLPLDQVAAAELTWAPAALHHRDRARIATVRAELDGDATFSDVLAAAGPAIAALDLPDGVQIEWGGESEGSQEANSALLVTLPIGAALLLFFLLLEFDSFRRVGIVLLTVPLAAVGVVPGLALTGQPFGFMSTLGVIALVGIVVNNAIVLLNVIEARRAEGADIDTAVADAVRVRIRPILLTTATTVSGMVPLAISSSTLWPPLAWAMISGLMVSTGLTLVAVPAVYRLLFGAPRWPRGRWLVALGLIAAAPASAAEMTLDDVLAAAEQAPMVVAADHRADAAVRDATTAWLAATGPSLTVAATFVQRDDAIEVVTPFGNLPQSPASQRDAGFQARVPLLDPEALARAPVATHAGHASRHDAERARVLARVEAGEAFLDIVALDAQVEANAAYLDALGAVADAARARVDVDLALPADALRAEVALADARQADTLLTRQREVASWRLGMALGLSEAVDPRFAAVAAPVDEDVFERALANRRDLQALDDRLRALRSERAAAWSGLLPAATLVGGLNTTTAGNLADDTWLEGGLELSWTPIARGTRPARHAAASSRIAAAEAERERLVLGIGVEVRAALAELAIAQGEIEVRSRSVAQAEEAARVTGERYGQGLASLTDVLQVQADVRAQRTRLRVAETDAARAGLHLERATGP